VVQRRACWESRKACWKSEPRSRGRALVFIYDRTVSLGRSWRFDCFNEWEGSIERDDHLLRDVGIEMEE
jgi:hypothetical protein